MSGAVPSGRDANHVASPPAASAGGILLALTQLGAMQFALAAGGLVRNKAMAVYLGPAGFGDFAQLASIAAVVYSITQLGMTVGLSRNAAAAAEGAGRQRQLSTANVLTVGVACVSVLLAGGVVLSSAGNPLLASLGIRAVWEQKAFLLVLLSIAPVEALRNNYASFLQGVLDIKGLSSGRTVAVILSTLAAVPLIAAYHTLGACVQALLASVLLAVLLGRRCAALGYRPLWFSWDPRVAATLGILGGASLLSGFAQSSVDAIIRAHLIAFAGVAENGLYQAALSLSAQVTAVVLGSVGAYALATVSQSRDRDVVTTRMADLLRVVLPVAALGLGALGLLGRPMLAILFAPTFRTSAKFLPLLLAANYVQAAAWVIGAPLLGGGLVRAWTIIQVLGVVVRYGVTVFGFAVVGVYAVPAGVLAAMVFDLVANFYVCRRVLGLGFDARTRLAFAAGGLAMAPAAWVGYAPHGALAYAASAAILAGVVLVMAWPALRPFVISRRRTP